MNGNHLTRVRSSLVAPINFKRGNDMNIGDYVYVYLFELEKTIVSMEQLRDDRFGIIEDKNILPCSNGEQIIVYKIKLLKNNQVIEYRSNNLSTNIASFYDLIDMIGRAKISQEKKDNLLRQLDEVVKG